MSGVASSCCFVFHFVMLTAAFLLWMSSPFFFSAKWWKGQGGGKVKHLGGRRTLKSCSGSSAGTDS